METFFTITNRWDLFSNCIKDSLNIHYYTKGLGEVLCKFLGGGVPLGLGDPYPIPDPDSAARPYSKIPSQSKTRQVSIPSSDQFLNE